MRTGGQDRARTDDLCFFRAALYQLSYLTVREQLVIPKPLVGETGLEPVTSSV